MKQLIIIRHGKSSWDLNVRDHDRPLNQRGIDDGHLVGSKLAQLQIKPELIWSSSATRALSTAVLISEKLDYNLKKLKINRALYVFDDQEQLEVIQDCDDSIDRLMIFSHNHGLTSLVNRLGNIYFSNLPTTGVVGIEFNVDNWQLISSGNTQFHLFPKQLK